MNTSKDLRTPAFILRRTNYGEADRILNLITPQGKISAIAKGVRKEKSKLAGGIEMFSLSELNIHLGKTNLGTITGARITTYYSNIITSLDRLELGSKILKTISRSAEDIDSPDFFNLTRDSLSALNNHLSLTLIEIWFALNLNKISGTELNLYRDTSGEKLSKDTNYTYDFAENAFVASPTGDFGTNEIKLLRFIQTNPISLVSRVKNLDTYLPKLQALVSNL